MRPIKNKIIKAIIAYSWYLISAILASATLYLPIDLTITSNDSSWLLLYIVCVPIFCGLWLSWRILFDKWGFWKDKFKK